MGAKRMITAQEVSQELSVSMGYAYRIIRMLNGELEDQGYATLPGKVNRDYYEYRFFDFGDDKAEDHDSL